MIGIDLRLKFKNPPSDRELMELQYNLMHRFGRESFKMVADGGKKVPFVRVAESGPDGTWVEILVRGGYYYQGFECGDGLRITAILLFLTRAYSESNVEVWYRPDADRDTTDEELKFDEGKALKLVKHFLDFGSLPFLEAFTRFQNRGGSESPVCPFCEQPMMRDYGGVNAAHFFCAGCKEEITFEGEGYKKWISEQQRAISADTADDFDLDDVEPF